MIHTKAMIDSLSAKGTGEVYITSNIYLAAALQCSGCADPTLVKNVDGKIQFSFSVEPGLNDAVKEYYAGELCVPALKYANGIKILKSKLYKEK